MTCIYCLYRRKPAWTDRILYKVGTNNYENVTLRAEQQSYKSHVNYTLSDHRPVTSDFNIKVRTNLLVSALHLYHANNTSLHSFLIVHFRDCSFICTL